MDGLTWRDYVEKFVGIYKNIYYEWRGQHQGHTERYPVGGELNILGLPFFRARRFLAKI
jgi:hypothetical protein